MFESPNNFESAPISEEAVIELLDSSEEGDPKVKEILGQYADQCHYEAEREAVAADDYKAQNRITIKCEIKLACLFLKTKKYKAQGVEQLEDIYRMAAKQNDDTRDLMEEIDRLLSN